MSFCTNCGTPHIQNAKFCPACGANIIVRKMDNNSINKFSDTKNSRRKIVPKPEKGKASKLFKKQTQDFVKEKAQDFIKDKAQDFVNKNISKPKDKPDPSNTKEPKNKTPKKINKWTWIYIIINALLVLLGSQSDEVIGVLIFSIIILGTVFFRRKKEKPYNWLVKIIQVLQIVLLFALIAESIEYISVYTLVFIGLLLTNILLLFKGNNS
jgi:hypothetical protein